MATRIHPTAIIAASAEIGGDAVVEAYAVIGPRVVIGPRTRVRPFAHVVQDTEIGADCDIHAGAIVGGDPQDLKFGGESTKLVIGNGNIIRECVTINRGTGVGGGMTRIGDHNMIMAYVHVAHDCRIGNGCIIANSTQLAGHIVLEDMVNISGLAAVHHFVTMGTMAFVAGATAVKVDVPPFTVFDGKVRKLNTEGFKRREIPQESRDALRHAFRVIYRSNLAMSEALERLENDPAGRDPLVTRLVRSCRSSQEGKNGRALERNRSIDGPKSKTQVIPALGILETLGSCVK